MQLDLCVKHPMSWNQQNSFTVCKFAKYCTKNVCPFWRSAVPWVSLCALWAFFNCCPGQLINLSVEDICTEFCFSDLFFHAYVCVHVHVLSFVSLFVYRYFTFYVLLISLISLLGAVKQLLPYQHSTTNV